MTNKVLSKVCHDAAKVIERDGFLKGLIGSNDGPKCMLGAMRYAHHRDVNVALGVTVSEQLRGLFHATRPRTRRDNVVDFNDANRTRKHDVVELLQDMAVQALR